MSAEFTKTNAHIHLFGLISLFLWHINLFGLFNTKVIIQNNSGRTMKHVAWRWENKGFHTFPFGISPKVNVIVRLELELTDCDVTVQLVSHYTRTRFIYISAWVYPRFCIYILHTPEFFLPLSPTLTLSLSLFHTHTHTHTHTHIYIYTSCNQIVSILKC